MAIEIIKGWNLDADEKNADWIKLVAADRRRKPKNKRDIIQNMREAAQDAKPEPPQSSS